MGHSGHKVRSRPVPPKPALPNAVVTPQKRVENVSNTDRQPAFQSMQIARKMVRELEILHEVRYGQKTWEIIERALVELETAIDDHYHPADTIEMFSDD